MVACISYLPDATSPALLPGANTVVALHQILKRLITRVAGRFDPLT